jgi:hypothetical protein
MYVVSCRLPQLVVVCIMSFLLMITQENVGYISLKLKVTLDKFKEYKAFIEKQIGKHIRILRTDNGGEFESL